MSKTEKLSIVEEAKSRYERAKEAYSASRALAIADTRFALGDSDNGWQWPDDIRRGRTAERKVCLTVNMTAQHCNQIINNMRQNRPQARILPADSGSDKKTAEIMAGLIRNIQATSSAEEAHDIAAEHCIYGGEGYWRVVTEYESETSFDQVIKIKPVINPLMVYIDPDAKELDKSDAKYAFIFEDLPRKEVERLHPNVDPASWIEDSRGWCTVDTVRIAEYFYCTYADDTALQLMDGTTVLKSEASPEQLQAVIQERATKRRIWNWCKLIGGEAEPVQERIWPGKYLPIVAVVGKEINIDGDIVRKGIVRDLKDSARMVNFSYSEAIQSVALQNKIPYIAAAEAIEGYEQEWKNANLSNKSYLPYNAYDDENNPLPRPERQQPAVMPAAQVQMLQLSTEQMRAASGQQNANFGIKSEAQSGVGIQRLKAQGEIATFHFPDNQVRGLRYEAKVLIDLIQKIYDTRRVVRVLGLDGKDEQATLDPDAQQSYQEQPTEEDIQKIFNPSLGQYDVVIDTGPSYQTQRQEAADALTQLSSKNPQLMQVAGDIIMRAYDFPMADQLAKRMEKTLPPGIQDESKNPQVMQAQQQVQELQQQLQQLGEEFNKLQESRDMEMQKLQIEQFNAETNREKAMGELEIKSAGLNQPERMETGLDEATKLEFDAELKVRLKQMDIEAQKELKLMELASQIIAQPVDTPVDTPVEAAQDHLLPLMQTIAGLAQQLSAPREIVRDENGRAIGVRSVGGM